MSAAEPKPAKSQPSTSQAGPISEYEQLLMRSGPDSEPARAFLELHGGDPEFAALATTLNKLGDYSGHNVRAAGRVQRRLVRKLVIASIALFVVGLFIAGLLAFGLHRAWQYNKLNEEKNKLVSVRRDMRKS